MKGGIDMKYKVGDLVIYIQNPQTVRRVRRVYGDMVLLWDSMTMYMRKI